MLCDQEVGSASLCFLWLLAWLSHPYTYTVHMCEASDVSLALVGQSSAEIKRLPWADTHQLHFMMHLLFSGLGFWFQLAAEATHRHMQCVRQGKAGRDAHFSSKMESFWKTSLIIAFKLMVRFLIREKIIKIIGIFQEICSPRIKTTIFYPPASGCLWKLLCLQMWQRRL